MAACERSRRMQGLFCDKRFTCYFVMVTGLSGVQFGLQSCEKSDDRAAGVQFAYHEYAYRLNWPTRSIIPITHKNYNFREKKNCQVMKEREICIKILTKEVLTFYFLPAIKRQNTKASACARTQETTTLNVIG